MSRRTAIQLAMCVVLFAIASPVLARETTDNPAYKLWSEFKPGAYAVHKQKGTEGKKALDWTKKDTLELVDDQRAKLVYEAKGMKGGEHVEESNSRNIQAKLVPPITDPILLAISDPKAQTEEVTITVAEEDIACTQYKATQKQGSDIVTNLIVCINEKIPGHVVMAQVHVAFKGRTIAEFKTQLAEYGLGEEDWGGPRNTAHSGYSSIY